METKGIAARKVIFVFHSVGKDYFPAAISADEGNFGREHNQLLHAEFLLKYELTLWLYDSIFFSVIPLEMFCSDGLFRYLPANFSQKS